MDTSHNNMNKVSHQHLVDQLKIKKIIQSQIVASCMSEVDRADFCAFLPYTDCKAPIGCEQHMEAPNFHAQILVNSMIWLWFFTDGKFVGAS